MHKYAVNTCAKIMLSFGGEGGGDQKITLDYRGEGGRSKESKKGLRNF